MYRRLLENIRYESKAGNLFTRFWNVRFEKFSSAAINILSWTLMHFGSICSFTQLDGNNSEHDVELEFKMRTPVIFDYIKEC